MILEKITSEIAQERERVIMEFCDEHDIPAELVVVEEQYGEARQKQNGNYELPVTFNVRAMTDAERVATISRIRNSALEAPPLPGVGRYATPNIRFDVRFVLACLAITQNRLEQLEELVGKL